MEDSRIDRLEVKIDSIIDKQAEQGTVLAENTIILKEHERRSTSNEEATQLLKQQLDLQKEQFYKELGPVKKFVDRAKFLGAVVGAILALDKSGVFDFLARIFTHIN